MLDEDAAKCTYTTTRYWLCDHSEARVDWSRYYTEHPCKYAEYQIIGKVFCRLKIEGMVKDMADNNKETNTKPV